MKYTSNWARLKSQEEWEKWLFSLKEEDTVILQEFIPRGKFCLDSQVECWKFWPARYQGNFIVYDNRTLYLKDGYIRYARGGSLRGDVFPERIVPFNVDINPPPHALFFSGHAPVWEPAWRNKHRCLVIVDKAPKYRDIKFGENFKYQYSYDVNEGKLFVVFGNREEIQRKSQEMGARFLYSTTND